MEFHLPDHCPFCGNEVSGGGNYIVFYRCGACIWVESSSIMDGEWILKGQSGCDCQK